MYVIRVINLECMHAFAFGNIVKQGVWRMHSMRAPAAFVTLDGFTFTVLISKSEVAGQCLVNGLGLTACNIQGHIDDYVYI